jgi:hypothetical protein
LTFAGGVLEEEEGGFGGGGDGGGRNRSHVAGERGEVLTLLELLRVVWISVEILCVLCCREAAVIMTDGAGDGD